MVVQMDRLKETKTLNSNGAVQELAEGVLAGNRRLLSRALTAVDNQTRQGADLLRVLHPHTGKAHVIGITGPAGAGKSTLTCEVAKEFRRHDKTVAIIAVDPSSPFAGGA